KKVVFATAWLATDNVFVALMRLAFGMVDVAAFLGKLSILVLSDMLDLLSLQQVLTGMNLVAIDTLHLFPTTLECAKLVEEKYAKKAMWKMPKGITTKDEFIAKYGDCEELDSADFDFVSKECEKDILITGRRMDQAAQRIKLDVWEDQKRTWTRQGEEGVPVNAGHNWAFRCDAPIEATSRHLPDLPWTKVDLGKPFWRCTDAEIKGSPAAPITYVFKSFGDMPLSPVIPAAMGLFRVLGSSGVCERGSGLSGVQGFRVCRLQTRWSALSPLWFSAEALAGWMQKRVCSALEASIVIEMFLPFQNVETSCLLGPEVKQILTSCWDTSCLTSTRKG
ncbi:sA, partial [Symbiodinium sp. CCMP2456]